MGSAPLNYKLLGSTVSCNGRPLRLEFPGAIYHVISRGNASLPIFEEDQDRGAFLAIVEEAVKQYNWLCFAYCLMDNHDH
jgi:hypothetical protein